MPSLPEALLVAMIGLVGVLAGAWIQTRRSPSQNRVDDAAAAERLATAAKTLVDPLRHEVVALRFQSDAQLKEIERQKNEIVELARADAAKGDEIRKLTRGQLASTLHIEKLDRKVVYLTNGIGILTSQITKAGLTPEWTYSQNDDPGKSAEGNVDGVPG